MDRVDAKHIPSPAGSTPAPASIRLWTWGGISFNAGAARGSAAPCGWAPRKRKQERRNPLVIDLRRMCQPAALIRTGNPCRQIISDRSERRSRKGLERRPIHFSKQKRRSGAPPRGRGKENGARQIYGGGTVTVHCFSQVSASGMRQSSNGRTRAFQARYAGSNPVCRSMTAGGQDVTRMRRDRGETPRVR